jgi:hypothetical protein
MIISFECYCATQWGEVLQIAGSATVLGGWKTEEALTMKCIAPNKWKVEIDIPFKERGPFSYKYLVKNIEHNTIVWEHGKNREFLNASASYTSIHIKDLWEPGNNVQFLWTTSAFTDLIFRRDHTLEKQKGCFI